MHQAGDGIFQLAPVDADRRVHREQIVLAGMIDMQMCMQNETHVAELHAMTRELVLDHVLVELQPAHAERFHDLVGAESGIDQDRPRPAHDQKAEREHAARAPAILPEHKEASFQFNIAVIENLDLKRHGSLPFDSIVLVARADRRATAVPRKIAS